MGFIFGKNVVSVWYRLECGYFLIVVFCCVDIVYFSYFFIKDFFFRYEYNVCVCFLSFKRYLLKMFTKFLYGYGGKEGGNDRNNL